MRSLTMSLSLASDSRPSVLANSSSTVTAGRRLERFGNDLELGLLAGELFCGVGLRESDVHSAGLARRDADELILEARNESAGADLHRDVAAGAAFERHAVDLAGEIDHGAVAALRLGALGLGGERPVLLGDLADGFVDLGVGDFGDGLFELDALEVGDLDRRHDLDRHRVGEIGLAFDHLLDRFLVGRQRDLRFAHQLQAAVGDDLGVGLAHRVLDRLGHHRAAVQALEMGDRHLAGTEAVEADLALERVEPLVGLGRQIGGGDHDGEFALEAFGESFSYLHHTIFVLGRAARRLRGYPFRCGCEPTVCAQRGAGGGTRTPTTFVTGT